MRKTLLLSLVLLSIATLASADSFVAYNSRAAQLWSDYIDWGQLGPPGTLVPTAYFGLMNSGTPFLAGNLNSSNFAALQQGNGWYGMFDPGENLMWTGNPNFAQAGFGPFAMAFFNPVSTVGFDIQADLVGPFTATIAAYDYDFKDLLFTTTINREACNLAGSCIGFLGIGDLSGANIYHIVISSDSGDPNWNNDFVINHVTLGYGPATPLPEPGSLALLATGLIGGFGAVRHRLKHF